MRLNGKLVGELTPADMQQLLDDRRPEDLYLDYKRDAYGKADSDKRELLKDIVGLANASGGVILIGVDEDGSNVAVATPGVNIDANQKDPMERYERTIRDGIEPRLTGLAVQAVPTGQMGKVIIAIGVPQSFNRPHRVKTNGSERWTIRRNRDVTDMTYAEIRSAFFHGANIEARVRGFQAERCEFVRSSGIGNGILLIHVIPLATDDRTLDVRAALQNRSNFFPPGFTPDQCVLRPNFDGVRAFSPPDQGHWRGWCQLYRDGKVEGVCGAYVAPDGQDQRLILNQGQLEYDIFAAVPEYVKGLAVLGFNPPYAVAVSLVNAGHSFMNHQQNSDVHFESPSPLATFEPIVIETASLIGSWHSALQPIFDQLWNGYGFSMCYSFHSDGTWKGR